LTAGLSSALSKTSDTPLGGFSDGFEHRSPQRWRQAALYVQKILNPNNIGNAPTVGEPDQARAVSKFEENNSERRSGFSQG